MKITFDPLDPADVLAVARVMSGLGASIAPTDDADDDDGAAPVNAAALDSKGTPWLADFHTDKRTTNQDGTWRRRKGVDKDAATRAEIAARGANPIATPAAAHAAPAPVAAAVAQVAPVAQVAAPTFPMPTAAPLPDLPQPVSIEQFMASLARVQSTRPDVLAARWAEMLVACGLTPDANGNAALNVNETARAKMVAMLNDIE